MSSEGEGTAAERDGHEEWCASCRGPHACDCGWTNLLRATVPEPSDEALTGRRAAIHNAQYALTLYRHRPLHEQAKAVVVATEGHLRAEERAATLRKVEAWMESDAAEAVRAEALRQDIPPEDALRHALAEHFNPEAE